MNHINDSQMRWAAVDTKVNLKWKESLGVLKAELKTNDEADNLSELPTTVATEAFHF